MGGEGGLAITTVADPVVLDDNICKVEDLFVDESHVIIYEDILDLDEEEPPQERCIQVRSLEDLQLIRSIRFTGLVNDAYHYANGLFIALVMTISRGQPDLHLQ